MALALVKSVSDALAPLFRPAGTLIEGVTPGSWASPQNPIRPTLQLGVGIRQWDFTPAINLQYTPRGDVAIKFPQLWNVSNSFDLCRLFIETRKDQIVNRPWVIRVKSQPGELKSQRLKREASNTDVAKVTEIFKYPDGVHDFSLWIRMWLEELLVFDAPTIYPVRSLSGEFIPGGLRLISGTTITPLLDNSGFTPAPPSPAYQQIILGIPTSNVAGQKPREFSAVNTKRKPGDLSELIYSPRNPRVNSRWGFPPVEQIITTMAIGANRQQFLKDYYTSGNVPEGLLPMPESWTALQIKDFQKWFDSMLAGNLQMKRRMIMIPDAKVGPTMTKHEALTDVTDDYLIRVVAYAFSISPQNLIKQVNKGTAKESSDVAQIEGLEPYLKHIENTMNGIIERTLGISDVEFAYVDEREMDPYKQAQTDQIYLDSGAYDRNEIRAARGDDPRPEPEASMLLAKGPGCVPIGQAATPAGADPEDEDQPEPAKKLKKRIAIRIEAGTLTPRSQQAHNDYKGKLIKFLGDQKARVSAKARSEFAAQKAAVPSVKKGEDDITSDSERAAIILANIDWDYYALYSLSLPYFETAAEEGARAGAHQVAANLGASLNDTLEVALPKAKQAAEDRAAEMAGLQVQDDGTLAEATAPQWAISTTAKDDVLAAIKQAIVEDWTPSQLEAVIQASVVWTPDHGELIADNEISRQQAGGHLTSWLASGKVLEYAWTTVGDDKCCPVCIGFEALGSVKSGYQFAPFIYAPGAHPFCRCWLTATKYEGEEE